jgi:hypothetical protein
MGLDGFTCGVLHESQLLGQVVIGEKMDPFFTKFVRHNQRQ